MQDRKEADLGAEVFWIGGDGLERFCGGFEEDVVNHLLILIGDGGDLLRYGENHVEIRAVEQLSLTMLDPLRSGQALTLWAVAIPARVEAVVFITALVAAFEMTTENCRAAHFDSCHHTPLFSGHRCAMILSISLAVATEHVRHLQLGAVHGRTAQKYWGTVCAGLMGTGRGSKSRGLVVEHTLLVAMRRYRAVVARLRWPSRS